MGVDLMLLPMTTDFNGRAYAHTTLEVQRRYELWPLIRALPSEPVPPHFESLVSIAGPPEWDSWVQGNTQVDCYENPVFCVLAEHLCSLAGHPAVEQEVINRAAWSYLAQLPGEMRVALYWA